MQFNAWKRHKSNVCNLIQVVFQFTVHNFSNDDTAFLSLSNCSWQSISYHLGFLMKSLLYGLVRVYENNRSTAGCSFFQFLLANWLMRFYSIPNTFFKKINIMDNILQYLSKFPRKSLFPCSIAST